MVNLAWYHSFLAVYQTGTVSAAARSLFLTQPAISQHIAALESAAGEAMFTRTPRRMVPTERGKELYSEIVEPIERLELISQNLKIGKGLGKSFKLGSPFEYFHERAMARLGKLPFRLWIKFGLAQFLVRELRENRFDAIIVAQKLEFPEIEYKKIEDENFILVGATDMKSPRIKKWDAEKTKVIERWLLKQNWLSYGLELPIIRRFWHEIFGKRPEIKPSLVMPSLHAILKAVALGYGISLLPEYLCKKALEQKRVKILLKAPRPITNEIWFAYRKIDRNHPHIREFSSQLCGKA